MSYAVGALAAVIVFTGSGLEAAVEPTGAAVPGRDGPIAFGGDWVRLGNPEGNRETFTMNLNGSVQSLLSFDTTFNRDPDWSPDGMAIAFATERDRNDEQRLLLIHESGHQPAHLRSSKTARTKTPSRPATIRAEDAAPA